MKTNLFSVLCLVVLLGCKNVPEAIQPTNKTNSGARTELSASYNFSPIEFYFPGGPSKPVIVRQNASTYFTYDSQVVCGNYNSYPITLEVGNNGYIGGSGPTLDILNVLSGNNYTIIDGKTLRWTIPPYGSGSLSIRFGVPVGYDDCATTVRQISPYSVAVQSSGGDLLQISRRL